MFDKSEAVLPRRVRSAMPQKDTRHRGSGELKVIGRGQMIIRSGLIRNRDGVDSASFAAHWRTIHAPLVIKIDGLRAYSQNLVVERLIDRPAPGMHRIDGISQLYFDDVEAMRVSMASPEQDACIVDLRGFLSDVTILVQSIGEPIHSSPRADPALPKSMFLLRGDGRSSTDARSAIAEALVQSSSKWRFRLNPIVSRDFIVDSSIPAGEQLVDGVLELWSKDSRNVDAVREVLSQFPSLTLVDGLMVEEYVVKA